MFQIVLGRTPRPLLLGLAEMTLKLLVPVAALLLASVGSANAYTAYIAPQDFTPDGDYAVAEAAFTTQFFTPQVGVSSPDFHALRPAGERASFSSFGVGPTAATAEIRMNVEGTYRISTGEIMGPIANMVFVDGAWRALAAGEVPAEGVDTSTLQTVAVAETYVSKVRPSDAAFATPTGRLAIRPITHPNRVSVASGFEVELLFDGQPFPNMPFVLYGQGDLEADLDRTFVTNDQGRATLTFDAPGTYLVAIRYRGPAPEGSGVAVRSYTTTLTFEAVQELAPIPPPTPPERPRRRRG
jgi:hypothetical protein